MNSLTSNFLTTCAMLAVFGAATFAARADVAPPTPMAMPPATMPSATMPAAAPAADYRLNPGDQLEISVLGHDDLKENVTILPDGSFSFPIAGRIHAGGMTVDQLDAALVRGLSNQLNQPQVNVSIQQTQVEKLSVLGAVKSPGVVDYKPGWRLLDALAAAGGPSQDPVQTLITLVRADGKQGVPVSAEPLLSGRDVSLNIPVEPGDVLLVQERDPSESEVQVLGAVEKPGVYSAATTGVSVVSLIAQAGGTTANAAVTQIQVMHLGKVRTVNLSGIESGDLSTDAAVLPGDALMVPENTAQAEVLGEVKNPGAYTIPDGVSAPLTTVLASVGGLTENADKKQVIISHPDRNGQRVRVAYDIGPMLKGETEPVSVHPGDVVEVETRHKGRSGLEILDGLDPLIFLGGILR